MIQIDPKQSEVYQKLAEAYIAVGNVEQAVAVLTKGYTTGWTQWQDALLGYAYYSDSEGGQQWTVEYRPQNGTGFVADWKKHTDGVDRNFWRGEMSQWLFEGNFKKIYEDTLEGIVTYRTITVGTSLKELYHGEIAIHGEGIEIAGLSLYYVYDNGIAQKAWEDPDSGEMVKLKRVQIQPDGSESVVYVTLGDSDPVINYVTKTAKLVE